MAFNVSYDHHILQYTYLPDLFEKLRAWDPEGVYILQTISPTVSINIFNILTNILYIVCC